jgi:hypothetical protein
MSDERTREYAAIMLQGLDDVTRAAIKLMLDDIEKLKDQVRRDALTIEELQQALAARGIELVDGVTLGSKGDVRGFEASLHVDTGTLTFESFAGDEFTFLLPDDVRLYRQLLI